MRQLGLLIALTALLALQAAAQNSKVTTGVLAQQQGNTAEAILKLEEALGNQALIKNVKLIPKAHYYLAKAYLDLAADTSKKELRTKYPDFAERAKSNYDKAISHPEGDTWKKQAILDNFSYSLWVVFFNDGISLFSGENNAKALDRFKASDELNPNHFLTLRMLGAAYVYNGDTTGCVNTLEKAVEVYKKRYYADDAGAQALRATPEFQTDSGQVSYVYQQLAVIYNKQGDGEKAIGMLEEGMKYTKDEALSRQELNIYQQNPALFEMAVKKFQEAIAANPKDMQIKVVFASMLDRNERIEEAHALFQEVYNADPKSIEANFGLARYYINQAAAVNEKKSKEYNEAKVDAMDVEVRKLLETAYPFMKFLHEAQPTEPEWLRQLVSITGNIGKDAEMVEYGKKLRDLSGN
ncbi:MAG: hypothetical protein NW241_05575 [Bacteroidia bacterium]|nr:hypothetical protein [Bacteroidia bacterium]